MSSSVRPPDRQLQASIGNYKQGAMPFLAVVRDPQHLPPELLGEITFSGCLNEAARYSGMDDHEIADEIHVCHGYFSRFMRGVAQQWAKRLVAFMRVTNSLAPLQWIAEQMGCELRSKDSLAMQLAESRARTAELERMARGRVAA